MNHHLCDGQRVAEREPNKARVHRVALNDSEEGGKEQDQVADKLQSGTDIFRSS